MGVLGVHREVVRTRGGCSRGDVVKQTRGRVDGAESGVRRRADSDVSFPSERTTK